MSEAEEKVVTEEVSSEAPKKEKKKNEKKTSKSNKPGLGAKISKFFKDLFSEFKKIVWYGKTQTIKSTGFVIISLVVIATLVCLIELGLSYGINWLGKVI